MAHPSIREFAPAKINLALHVIGQRGDGYHLLDSLVAFANVGDWLTVAPAKTLSLVITGPQTEALRAGDDNLVLRAARSISDNGAALVLEKHLPIASGIGGGSADAAAALKALTRLWAMPMPDAATVLRLGADVPACLAGGVLRMQGTGERLSPLAPLPETHILLVNPGVAVATPAVFKALPCKTNPPLPTVPEFASAAAFANWLASQRNDLEVPATLLAPIIDEVKSIIAAQPGCLLPRMSGSGATCFGLFATAAEAQDARLRVKREHPGWWVEATHLLGSS